MNKLIRDIDAHLDLHITLYMILDEMKRDIFKEIKVRKRNELSLRFQIYSNVGLTMRITLETKKRIWE